MTEATKHSRTGLVAIGRNEGERLRVCLESSLPRARHVVYVDSGSTDGSVALARSLGATVVELDTTVPFTAAWARNAGFERLDALAEDLEFVQFVDGDCELEPGWLDRAHAVMREEPDAAVVCGRRRERFPEASVYNLLCDMEWDTPIGPAAECGGDALMRVEAFRRVGGYRPDLIAGEEPELCSRLIAEGGRVLRIDEPMTLHDARMTSFRQWWTRNVRSGHANAEGGSQQVAHASARASRETRSTWLWGGVLPLAMLVALAIGVPSITLALAVLYAVQVVRIARREPRPRFATAHQYVYAASCVLGKLPNVQGQLRYAIGRLTGRRSALIEYKGPESAPRDPTAT